MIDISPTNISINQSNPGDPRLGQFVQEDCSNPEVVLIGFPSDEGIKRNGGRPGAAQAPDAIRRQLYKLTPDVESGKAFTKLLETTNDAGNVKTTDDLEADQDRLGEILSEYLVQGCIPIILGGGHGTAFGHFLGYVKAGLKTSIFNLDAHTDVRPLKDGKAHSGSPFRQAIKHENDCCQKYTVMGLQPHSVAQSHLQFIKKHGGEAVFKDNTNLKNITNKLVNIENRCMITFDTDAVDQAFAPGVSAPCTNGLKPRLWLKAAYQVGKNEQVTSFDLVEVNPKYGQDEQTTRLAALTIWHFLKGLSER